MKISAKAANDMTYDMIWHTMDRAPPWFLICSIVDDDISLIVDNIPRIAQQIWHDMTRDD